MSLEQDVTTLSDIEELDWTQLLDAYDYARPQRGELREGVVMQIEENGILVSIGTKREGVIPQQDLRQMGDEFLSGLKVGAPIQAIKVLRMPAIKNDQPHHLSQSRTSRMAKMDRQNRKNKAKIGVIFKNVRDRFKIMRGSLSSLAGIKLNSSGNAKVIT
jgi:ribosomal protein S1